jgi:hypothetical protein
MNEFIYKEFDELVHLLIEEYFQEKTNSYYKKIVKKLSNSIKQLYKNKEIFEYVLEKYYSQPLNPFTSAYHDFMNLYNSGNQAEDLFIKISDGILRRLIYEKLEKDIFTIFP